MCGRWDGRPSIDYHPGGSVYRIARWVFTYLAHWHMALINKIGHACVPNTYQRWPYRENQLCSSLYCKIGTAYCHIHHLIEVIKWSNMGCCLLFYHTYYLLFVSCFSKDICTLKFLVCRMHFISFGTQNLCCSRWAFHPHTMRPGKE